MHRPPRARFSSAGGWDRNPVRWPAGLLRGVDDGVGTDGKGRRSATVVNRCNRYVMPGCVVRVLPRKFCPFILGYDAGPMTQRHEKLDCQRLLCPMPVIRVQDAVASLQAGDLLSAVCTDPGVLQDIPAWCRINGHEIVAAERGADEYVVTLRVGDH